MLDFPAMNPGASVLKTDLPDLSKDGKLPPAPAPLALAGGNMESYINSLGLKPSQLNEEQIAILMVAKKLEHFIEDLKIPSATIVKNDNRKIMVEKEVEEMRPKTRYKDGHVPTDIPDNNLDIRTISSPNELVNLRPTEWLMEDIDEKYFLTRLSQNSLMRDQWLRTDKVPVTSYEAVKVKILVEAPAPPQILKQHAAVLIDRSGSMNEGLRSPLSKALAIAFLKHGFDNQAILNVRAFHGDVENCVKGKELVDLRKTVIHVLQMEPRGNGTDIEHALKVTSQAIKIDSTTKRADILLISDGLSELSSNPLGDIKLHTIMVGNPNAQDAAQLKHHTDILKSWSTTFKTVDDANFQELKRPEVSEIEEVRRQCKPIPELLEQAKDPKVREALIERGKNVNALMKHIVQNLKEPNNSSLKKMQLKLEKSLADEAMKEAERKAAEQKKKREQDLLQLAKEQARQEAQKKAIQEKSEKATEKPEQAPSEKELEKLLNPPPKKLSFFKWLVKKAREIWTGESEDEPY